MHTSSTPVSGKQSMTGVRLRRHADYQRAYAAARKRQSPSMSWFLAVRAADDRAAGLPARIGLTAGKVLGKAHERNRIKRRMREVIRRHVASLPHGMDLILHPRRIVMTMDFRKLEGEIVRILTQARTEAARMGTSSQSKVDSAGPDSGADLGAAPTRAPGAAL